MATIEISELQKTSEALGATLPAEVTQLAVDIDKVRTAEREPIGTLADVTDAVYEAHRAGRKPADDKKVQRAVIAHQASTILGDFGMDRHLDHRLEDMVRDQFDNIVGAWKPAVTEAGRELAEAAESLPDDLNDAAGVLALGPDGAAAWATARGALDKINRAVAGWQQLARQIRVDQPQKHGDMLILADVDLATAEEFEHEGGTKNTAWALARAGHSFELPTLDEYRARRQRYDDADEARQARQVAEDRARTNEALAGGMNVRLRPGEGKELAELARQRRAG